MFVRNLFQKSAGDRKPTAAPPSRGCLTAADVDPHIVVHYGIPSTASVLAFDPVQSLLAVGTLDGRIKVIGGDNIEAILASSKQLPFKNLEFIQNQGLLVSVSNDNEIQVWDLDRRQTASSLHWESNITAFSILCGTGYMYIGDEYGMVSVLKYDAEEGKLAQLPYYVPADALAEAVGLSSPIEYPVVGLLSQPCSRGNRLLIAFSNGLLFLWDASEDRVVLVRGNRDLPLEGKTVCDSQEASQDELSDLDMEGKEISSLCWASNDESVLAVGYVDGDILFWNFSDGQVGKSSNHVVKLQLSSAEKRLPVIVMHWCSDVSRKDCGGKLCIYGGDIIGSEEVLTMLSLEWSSGMGGLKCVGRADLTLNGSFADMVLSPIASSTRSGIFLFQLTNPGQLHTYDDTSLASLMSQKDKKVSVTPQPYPMVVPTMDPHMTVVMLATLHGNEENSKTLSQIVLTAKARTPRTPSAANAKWPLTGGVPSQPDDHKLERLYIAGYQDGSVRIWDATYPSLSLMYTLGPKVNGIDLSGADASVSSLDFCSNTLCLAVGNECGMVRLYKLVDHKVEANLKVVTSTDKQVHFLRQEDGPQCLVAFSFLSSSVCTLKLVHSARRLVAGFKCGRVAMLDVVASSVMFITDSISDPCSPIRSLSVKSFSEATDLTSGPDDSEFKNPEVLEEMIVCAMTRDAKIIFIDGNSGIIIASSSKHLNDPTAIYMHIIEYCNENFKMHVEQPLQGSSEKGEPENKSYAQKENLPQEGEHKAAAKTKPPDQRVMNSLILLCCEDAVRLYSLESLSQGSVECILEVNLSKPCCWAATLSKDGKECGLLLLYRTGHMEVRSFPDFEVVGDSSLMSILRWNFKTNMEKTVCSDDKGHVVLVNGCEIAILSYLAHENSFRIPESLPSLHDEVLAAAADAAFSMFPAHKKKRDGASRILGGIMKNFRSSNEQKLVQEQVSDDFSHLKRIFSNPPYLKPPADDGVDEQIMELNIDDIEIDEPITVLPSSEKNKDEKKDKRTEKERLFEGASSDSQPRMRSVDEIKAKYKKAGDTSAIASQAKDKLLERQEKLSRISERTAELESGAENFASLANELVKQMEKRKWWHI